MKKLKILSVFCMAFLICGLFAQPAWAILGDVNGDTWVNTFDVIYLISYLFQNGPPPPNPIDADVDGSPGINLGDVLQLQGYLFMGCNLIPYTGVSVEVGSNIRISSQIIPPDTTTPGTSVTIPVKIIENEGPYLTGFVIPLSYASDSGQVEVTLDNVSFSGGITPGSWYTGSKIDNVNKRTVFFAYANPQAVDSIDSGTIGVIAELHFTRTSLDPLPLVMSTTQVPPSHSIMLIKSYCAGGEVSPSERIFTPKISLARAGDCNGDGILNASDVVYLTNYLYIGGPPPTGL